MLPGYFLRCAPSCEGLLTPRLRWVVAAPLCRGVHSVTAAERRDHNKTARSAERRRTENSGQAGGSPLPDVAGTFPEHEVVAAKRLCDLFSFVRSVCFVVKFTDKMFRQCSGNL